MKLKEKGRVQSRSNRSNATPQHPPAACTIISRNYLSHARILASSYLRHHRGARFYVLSIDALPDGWDPGKGVRVIGPEELDLPFFSELCFKYDVTELCTAVKPALLSVLLTRYHEEAVVYLDPDILVMRRLDELLACLPTSEIVLTPHLLKPIPPDGLKPAEQDILVAGAYNLGFIAVRKCDIAQQFLDWWQIRLKDGCFVDVSQGLMTDQKWIDLVPAMFGATILKDETYNVAYWNIHSRTLTREGEKYLVNGRPLAFFHFSGFDPARPDIYSKHQNRTSIVRGTALSDLLDLYRELHFQNGFETTRKWRYGYGSFDNGLRISLPMRRAYCRLSEEDRAIHDDPFSTDGATSFLHWAINPASSDDQYSPFLRALYDLRPDVAAAYPDIRGKDRDEFLEWASTSGPQEFGYDPAAMRVYDNGRPFSVEIASVQAGDETGLEGTSAPLGPKCSIIIPVFNNAALTRACLDRVLATMPADIAWEIVVIDDASTDATADLLGNYGDRIRIVSHAVNKGFSISCNDGAAIASGQYLVFLNNDTVPQQGWLEALVQYADRHPESAVVGSKLLFPNDTIQHCGIVICADGEPRHLYSGFPANHPLANKPRRLKAVTGACMLIRQADFRAAGGFDRAYTNGYEDVDLCLRLGEAGRETHCCPESTLYHLEAVTRSLANDSQVQNRKLFNLRWKDRVPPDELDHYLADGLLKLDYPGLYPIQFSISPLLATINRERDRQYDKLIEERSRQVFGLLKDNIRLNVRIQESELRAQAGNGNGRAHKHFPNPVEDARTIHKGQIHWPSNRSTGRVISVILPVKNGEAKLRMLLPAIASQQTRDCVEIVAVDSGSTDGSVDLLIEANATVLTIDPRTFNHGLTRNLATKHASGSIFVFLNQSTLPADKHWLANLISAFDNDPTLAAVCGRILPRPDADLLTAREINANVNASKERIVTEILDRNLYQSLTPHIRRTFVNFHTLSAAIRADIFRRIPFREANFAEDLIWGKEALESGLRIQFEPSSVAFHSHNYSLLDIFRRNFDDGLACHRIIGITMKDHEIAPHMGEIQNIWRSLEKDASLQGESLERYRLEAAVRRAAQVFGQWLGLNFQSVNGNLEALLSITEQIKAGAKTEISEERGARAGSAR
jgi:GT2 family glycosyltransferase